MYCKKCGEENSNEARFCKNCGNPIGHKNVEAQMQKEVVIKKKHSKKWIILFIIILLIAVVSGIYLVKKTIKEKLAQDYQDYIAQANKYVELLDYENAEDFYLKAIEINPKQKEPYIKLTDIYLTQEEYDKAIEILERAEEAIKSSDSSENGNGDVEDDSEIEQKKHEIKERAEYSWVVKPTIEADDIYYVTDTGYYKKSRNGTNLQFKSPYAVIKKGNAMGLIDMDGVIKGELKYKNIACFAGERYILQSIEPASADELPEGYYSGDTWDMYLMADDEIVLAEGIGSGGPGYCAVYWCNGLHHVDEVYGWENYVMSLTMAIPVQQSSQLFSQKDGDGLSWWMSLEGKYAVCKDGRLTTDFIYDKCGSLAEGLLAVCQNGKWGYINEDGETIIPIEYDESWERTIGESSIGINIDGEKKTTEEYCYAASEGCVPLVKDGKWELRDTKGNLLILPGIFDAIRPMYEGKCWVKKDGKWGVIKLEDMKQIQTEDTGTTEATASDIYRRIYMPILQESSRKYDDDINKNIYYIYDIDKDGTKELLVQEGTCEADYMYQIYTIKYLDTEYISKYLGEISGFHCALYADENGGTEKYIIRSEGHMGYGRVSHVSIENGQVVEQEISMTEDDEYYSNDYLIPSTYVTDYSLLK